MLISHFYFYFTHATTRPHAAGKSHNKSSGAPTGWVFAKLIHGDKKEWVTRHSQWKVLPHDDASSTELLALFQLCRGLSTLGPYGLLRNGGWQRALAGLQLHSGSAAQGSVGAYPLAHACHALHLLHLFSTGKVASGWLVKAVMQQAVALLGSLISTFTRLALELQRIRNTWGAEAGLQRNMWGAQGMGRWNEASSPEIPMKLISNFSNTFMPGDAMPFDNTIVHFPVRQPPAGLPARKSPYITSRKSWRIHDTPFPHLPSSYGYRLLLPDTPSPQAGCLRHERTPLSWLGLPLTHLTMNLYEYKQVCCRPWSATKETIAISIAYGPGRYQTGCSACCTA